MTYGNDGPCTMREAQDDDSDRTMRLTPVEVAQLKRTLHPRFLVNAEDLARTDDDSDAGEQKVPESTPASERAGDAQDGRTTAEWIADLVKARQQAEADLARSRLDRGELADEVNTLREQVSRLPDRLQRAEAERDEWKRRAEYAESSIDEALAKVARVEALADDWAAGRAPTAAAELRAALARGTRHGMLPGSHEQPSGAECRCGASWDQWKSKCAALAGGGE